MKKILLGFAALFLVGAPVLLAIADESDDVFLDDAGFIDEPLADDAPAAAAPAKAEPAPAAKAAVEADDDDGMPPMVADEPPAKKAAPGKPAKKQVAKPKAKPARATASKGGFRVTKSECKMHESPAAESAVLTQIAAAKKIWVEDQGDGWVKAFRKGGEGYVSADCLQ